MRIMTTRRFVHGDREWAIDIEGRKLTVHLGARGGRLRSQLRMFDSADEAAADAERQIAEKLGEGFAEEHPAPADEPEVFEFESITAAEACARELLDDEALEQFGLEPGDEVLVHRGDLRSTSDLIFDAGLTMIIDGSMETTAGVLNSDPLIVRGNVRARDFETYSWSEVHGTITLEGFLYGDSTCDCRMDAGAVSAAVVIDAGHSFAADVSGCVTVALQAHGGGLLEPTCVAGEEATVLVDEVLSDGAFDLEKLRERSEARQPLVRRPR